MNKKKIIRTAIATPVSLALLYFVFKDMNFSEIGEFLFSANPWYIALAIFFFNFPLVLRGLRWRLLFDANSTPNRALLIESTFVGFFINNIIPARVGEYVRAYFPAKIENRPIAPFLATIVNDRMLDMLSVLIYFLSVSLFIPELSLKMQDTVNISMDIRLIMSLAALLLIGLMFSLVFFFQAFRWLYKKCLVVFPKSFRPRFYRFFLQFRSGISWPNSSLRKAYLLIHTCSYWALLSFGGSFLLLALGVNLETVLQGGAVLVLASSLGSLLPLAPGYAGTMDIAMLLAMRVLGLNDGLSAAVVLGFRITTWLPQVVIGLIIWFKRGKILFSLERISKLT